MPHERALRQEWSWFPRIGQYGLIGLEGYAVGTSGSQGLTVAFTVVENFAPFYEVRHFRPVPKAKAATVRATLVEQLRRGKLPPKNKLRRPGP